MRYFLVAALIAALTVMSTGTSEAHHLPRPFDGPGNDPYYESRFGETGSHTFTGNPVDGGSFTDMVVGWAFHDTVQNPSHEWYVHNLTLTLDDCAFEEEFPLWFYNESKLILKAPRVLLPSGQRGAQVTMSDNTTLDITGGQVDKIVGFGESEITVTDTRFRILDYAGTGTATLNGVAAGEVESFGGSVLISGGNIVGLKAGGSDGRISMTGGEVGSATAMNVASPAGSFGTIDLTGTKVIGSVDATGGKVTVSGGEIGSAGVSGDGSITLAGGKVQSGVTVNDGALTVDDTIITGDAVALKGVMRLTNTLVGGVAELRGSSGVDRMELTNGSYGAVQASNGTTSVSGARITGSVNCIDDCFIRLRGNTIAGGGLSVSGRGNGGIESLAVSINRIDTFDTATAHMLGGTVRDGVSGRGASTVNLSLGTVSGDVVAAENSTINLIPGILVSGDSGLGAFGSANVFMIGGLIQNNLVGFQDSITTMIGGQVGGLAVFRGNAQFRYFGGSIGGGVSGGGGLSSLSRASSFGECEEEDGCEEFPFPPIPASLTGLTALDNSRIEIYGRDLQYTLVDPNYEGGLYSLYQLTGRLADGTILQGDTVLVQNGTAARFELFEIPEPTSVLLLIGLVALSCNKLRIRVATPT